MQYVWSLIYQLSQHSASRMTLAITSHPFSVFSESWALSRCAKFKHPSIKRFVNTRMHLIYKKHVWSGYTHSLQTCFVERALLNIQTESVWTQDTCSLQTNKNPCTACLRELDSGSAAHRSIYSGLYSTNQH